MGAEDGFKYVSDVFRIEMFGADFKEFQKMDDHDAKNQEYVTLKVWMPQGSPPSSYVRDFKGLCSDGVATVADTYLKCKTACGDGRRRVSLLDYIGGSGRILGQKLDKDNRKSWKINFFDEFWKIQKIKKRI